MSASEFRNGYPERTNIISDSEEIKLTYVRKGKYMYIKEEYVGHKCF